MGSAFHQLCPRYSGTLTPTAPTAIKLWDTFTFFFFRLQSNLKSVAGGVFDDVFLCCPFFHWMFWMRSGT